MKLLYAECCGSLVVPSSTDHEPRWCKCHGAACWWTYGRMGRFACYSNLGRRQVSILGLHNGLLQERFKTYHDSETEYGCIQRDAMKKMIDECPSSYIFKHVESLVIRIRPEFSNDTFFVPHISGVPSEHGNYSMCGLTVNVDGTEVEVSANGRTKVAQVMGMAMDAAKRPKTDLGEWTVKNSRRQPLDAMNELSYYGVLGLGHTLLLNPPHEAAKQPAAE